MFTNVLNKIKVIAGLSVTLQVIRVFFPQLDVGEDFQGSAAALIDSLYVLVPIIVGWFVKESDDTLDALVVKVDY